MGITEKEFGQGKTILKFFPHEAAACLVPTTMAPSESDTVVKAGTPYPSNDGDCVGLLLYDVDVKGGAAPGAYVYAGVVDPAKIAAGTVSAAAKKSIPRVTFYGEPFGVTGATGATGAT